MSINSNNLDKWLFDYYEGNLSPDDIRRLEQYLKKNPEYYEDAQAWKESFVEESVPAFSTAFLVKNVEPSGNRRKLAYAAILLLLFSGSMAIYYMSPSAAEGKRAYSVTGKSSTGNQTNDLNFDQTINDFKNAFTASHTPVQGTAFTANHQSDANETNNTETVDHAAAANLSFVPEINKLQNMVRDYNENALYPTNGINAQTRYQSPVLTVNNNTAENNSHTTNGTLANRGNRTVENNNHSTVNNINGSIVPVVNVNNPGNNQYVAENTAIAVNNNNTSTENNALAANGNNSTSVENQIANQLENIDNNTVANNNTAVSSNTIVPEPNGSTTPSLTEANLAEVKTDLLNSSYTEDINLTLENAGMETETVKEENTLAENKDIKQVPAVKDEKKLSEKTIVLSEGPSELNPDNFTAKPGKEEVLPKSIDVDKTNKTDIPLPKGLGFTNRRQVTLLQGIYSEFENNASFISQHYMLDAYAGARFTNASPIESGAGQMIGASQYFRKAKTTVNAYGFHDQTGYIGQAGMVVQVATQFKIDRYQSIIPSFSVSATQYKFQQMPAIASGDAPSYSAGLLTGSPAYYAFNDATKMNLSLGALYHHKKFFTGLSMNGLLQSKFKYEINDRPYNATNYTTVHLIAGTDFVSKKYPELSLSPQMSITVRNLEADFTGGAVLRYKSWGVGAGLSATGAINTYMGYSHRMFGIQYRFMYDKLDAPFKGVSGHNLTAHFNLKSFIKKQKPILDSEK